MIFQRCKKFFNYNELRLILNNWKGDTYSKFHFGIFKCCLYFNCGYKNFAFMITLFIFQFLYTDKVEKKIGELEV